MLSSPFKPRNDVTNGPPLQQSCDSFANITPCESSTVPSAPSTAAAYPFSDDEQLQLVMDSQGKVSVCLSSEVISQYLYLPTSPLAKDSQDPSTPSFTVLGSSPYPTSLRSGLAVSSPINEAEGDETAAYIYRNIEGGSFPVNPRDTLIDDVESYNYAVDAMKHGSSVTRINNNNNTDNYNIKKESDYFFSYKKRRGEDSDDTIDNEADVEPPQKRSKCNLSETSSYFDVNNGSTIPVSWSRRAKVEAFLAANPELSTVITHIRCCNEVFTDVVTFADHLDKLHPIGFRTYFCSDSKCVWSILGFRIASECSRHFASVHCVKSHTCGQCLRRFSRNDALQRHVKRIHRDI